jgi:hypothetical protein
VGAAAKLRRWSEEMPRDLEARGHIRPVKTRCAYLYENTRWASAGSTVVHDGVRHPIASGDDYDDIVDWGKALKLLRIANTKGLDKITVRVIGALDEQARRS